MKDYTEPATRKNPEHMIIHVEAPDVIAEDTFELTLKLKTNSWDVSSGI